MNKKLLLFIITIFIFNSFTYSSYAQKTTSTPTPTASGLQLKVDELKNKIASKVAQLNLVEKRGIYGIVTENTDLQITLKDLNGKIRFIDVDELTKFSSDNSKSFGTSDIKKGMYLGVLGLYNKESQRLQARLIMEKELLPQFIFGAVSNVDKENFTITVAKENGAENIIDIENLTRTFLFADGELAKSGFSKIEVGQTIIVIGFFDKQDNSKILGSRIILFPEISVNTKINLSAKDSETIISTGSGNKLTPMKLEKQ